MISEDLLKLAFFPTVAGGMALYSGVRAHREYQGARLSRRWLSVEGTVIASRVEEIITQRKNGVQVNHRPRIRYRYAIGEKEHESERIYFGAEDSQFWTSRTAGEIVRMYAPGTKCRVFVDPARPTETVLRRGVTSHASSMLLMCIATTTIALIFIALMVVW